LSLLTAAPTAPKRVLLFYCDTGGGHRSAAQAVAESLLESHRDQVEVRLVDLTDGYLPPPLDQLDTAYRDMQRSKGRPWRAWYRLSANRHLCKELLAAWWRLVRPAIRRLLSDHSSDVVVCCHPLFNHAMVKAAHELGMSTPLITLVTDLADAHPSWVAPGVSMCLAPTEAVRKRVLSCGLPADCIEVTGLPVSRQFELIAAEDVSRIRLRLGLVPDLTTVLLVGGADGIGALYQICAELDQLTLDIQVVVIAGKNALLREQLEARAWSLPVRVLGHVGNMHEWMRAADAIVTKAGPSTISEALVVGLPIIVSGAIPGQEEANVQYLVEAGAGIWAPTPAAVAAALHELVSFPDRSLHLMASQSRTLADPEAAHRVAELVWHCAFSPRGNAF
jgi:1,2-diacylglycerol 3-beta-galactosyltransferase